MGAETYSEQCRTSKMKRFAEIVYTCKVLTIFAKRSILDVWHGSEYASGMSSRKGFIFGTYTCESNSKVKMHDLN